ncbi:hypothetical protein [Kocuria varians]|uniref:hypothetical protein n=1 Tax=Kocuria varians TaxID=1272 RepID=UPI000838620D|nr:hypothetical protein [Kocuria varians]
MPEQETNQFSMRGRLHDDAAYQDARRTRRREALEQLTAEASEAGFYEYAAEAYKKALEEARRSIEAENH